MNARLDDQIDLWRAHMERRGGMTAADVDELEDHVRHQVEALEGAGLSQDEAFLIAVKRLGSQDDIAREFARENSKRLWKQLVIGAADERESAPRSSWVPMMVCAALGALLMKLPALWGGTVDSPGFVRNFAPLALTAVVAYLLWRRRPPRSVAIGIIGAGALVAGIANLYPLDSQGDALAMTALHIPALMWLVVVVAYAGARWRETDGLMDAARFTGEWLIYMTLLALGGGVLVGLVAAVAGTVGLDAGPFLADWVILPGIGSASVVAAWLVFAKQSAIENMAPVLARVFTPLFAVAFAALLGVVLTSGQVMSLDRDLLAMCDGVLVVAVALILYTLTARGDDARAGWFDVAQVALASGALALDAIALVNILARIDEGGWTLNRVVILGANLLLLVNLAVSLGLLARLLRGRPGAVRRLERWQTSLLPAYALWGVMVVVALPPLFGLVGSA